MHTSWELMSARSVHEAVFFLFLAKGRSGFAPADTYADRSPHLEGHQFFCHARCFRSSVPQAMQYGLRLALDEDPPPS